MDVLERFKKEFADVKNKSFLDLLSNVQCYDYGSKPPSQINPDNSIFVGKDVPVGEILSVVKSLNLQHFIQLNRPDSIRDVVTACMMLKKPGNFLRSPIPFFVNNFEGDRDYARNVRSKIFRMKTATDKYRVLSEIEEFARTNSRTKPLIAHIQLLIDELITNAFYNAPVDLNGQPLYRHIGRSREIRLDKPVRAFIAHDRLRLVIGCEDLYGSVDRTKIVELLYKVYSNDRVHVPAGDGGAGIGLKMVMDNSVGFYLVVHKNIKSMFFCVLHLGESLRRLEKTPKSLHIAFY